MFDSTTFWVCFIKTFPIRKRYMLLKLWEKQVKKSIFVLKLYELVHMYIGNWKILCKQIFFWIVLHLFLKYKLCFFYVILRFAFILEYFLETRISHLWNFSKNLCWLESIMGIEIFTMNKHIKYRRG